MEYETEVEKLWFDLKTNYDEKKLQELIRLFKEESTDCLNNSHSWEFSARFALPQVGDLVFEFASQIRGREKEGLGKLIKVVYPYGGDHEYTIECVDGKVIKWSNCTFYKVLESTEVYVIEEKLFKKKKMDE